VTFTVTGSTAMNPGMVTEIVVWPAANGSNRTPPLAKLCDRESPTTSGVVTVCPVVVFVTS
jgi:hypothetical protein